MPKEYSDALIEWQDRSGWVWTNRPIVGERVKVFSRAKCGVFRLEHAWSLNGRRYSSSVWWVHKVGETLVVLRTTQDVGDDARYYLNPGWCVKI